MSLSFQLWKELPYNLLKMTYRRWCKLELAVQSLIVQLAKDQKFKCALCDQDHRLVIEHDHEPQEGLGYPYTIYNIRGLVCSRCNWHLMVHEHAERGEFINWENASSYFYGTEYEDYIYAYECRVAPLIEAALEERMGSANYWRRRITLQRLDEWYYEGGPPPSWWVERTKRQKFEIETPEQALNLLVECMQYVAREFERDSTYRPPDEFWRMMIAVRPIIDQALALSKHPPSAQR